MFKKILVPLDLTEKHQQAFKNAVELARQSGGMIALLHVIEVIPGLSRDEEKDFYNRLERKANHYLERQASILSENKIPCQNKILYGNRAQEIARYADEARADLIVLTAPQIEPDHPSSWGSLSYKVGILARCPVLLVK